MSSLLAVIFLAIFCIVVPLTSKTHAEGFDLEVDTGVSDILHRIDRRRKDQQEFYEGRQYPPVLAQERCGSTKEIDKRSIDDSEPQLRRKKRATIAWPIRSKFTAELYYAIPIIAPQGINIPVAFGIPFSFDIPNVTDTVKFRKRSIEDRYSIYGALEGIFHSFGLDGRSCVQRAICERAEHHFLVNGVFSELVNLILSVTASSMDGLMYDYVEAENQGRYQGRCKDRFSSCPFSIFKLLRVS